MGLLKSIINAASGTMADQWVDFFTCDSLDSDTLMAVGTRPVQAKSGNRKYSENIITNGAKINVADGQCMLICENGKIVDFCAEPGQYTYDNTIQPSILAGGFKDLGATFQQIGKRFLAGGAATDEQRIYYVNTKEIIGNKIGFANIPFRDSEFQFTMKVKGFGQYTFKIVNPLLFYKELAGNVSDVYERETLASTMKAEVMNSIQPALGKIAAKAIPYDQLINYPDDIGTAVDDVLSARWGGLRGIEIVSFAIESITVDEESAKKISQFQEARVLSNAQMAAGRMVSSTANAMETAAGNSAGAMTGFMGMGFAQNAGGIGNLSGMFQQTPPPQQPAPAAPAAPADGWACSCGATNTGKFCASCGSPKPAPAGGWKCNCGQENTGKFCQSCGSKKPDADPSWACTNCGHPGNLGKFCAECGGKKPAGMAQYRCDKCGWEPADKTNPPKFCPECGDLFDNNDIV